MADTEKRTLPAATEVEPWSLAEIKMAETAAYPPVPGGSGDTPKPIGSAARRPRRQLSPVGFAVIVMAVPLVMLIAYASTRPDASPDATSAPTGFVIGVAGGTTLTGLPAAVSKEAFQAYVKADVAKDEYGIKEMIHSGDVFVVEPGTRVLPLEYAFTLKGVRILEGKHAGKMAWTFTEYVIPR